MRRENHIVLVSRTCVLFKRVRVRAAGMASLMPFCTPSILVMKCKYESISLPFSLNRTAFVLGSFDSAARPVNPDVSQKTIYYCVNRIVGELFTGADRPRLEVFVSSRARIARLLFADKTLFIDQDEIIRELSTVRTSRTRQAHTHTHIYL